MFQGLGAATIKAHKSRVAGARLERNKVAYVLWS